MYSLWTFTEIETLYLVIWSFIAQVIFLKDAVLFFLMEGCFLNTKKNFIH